MSNEQSDPFEENEIEITDKCKQTEIKYRNISSDRHETCISKYDIFMCFQNRRRYLSVSSSETKPFKIN